MNLPPEFIATIQNTFREEGKGFLEALPDMIAEASARWGLTDVRPVPALSYNFVAFAKRPSTALRSAQDDVVLKMCVPNREARSEMAAFRLFNGEGACRLLDHGEERFWMLLERLQPGVMLASMDDDKEATRIAAEVMKRIWIPLDSASLLAGFQKQPSGFHKFIQLTDWFFGGSNDCEKCSTAGRDRWTRNLWKE